MRQRHQFRYGIFLLFTFYFLILSACSITKQISKSAKQTVIEDSSLVNAHVGISIYEPATGKYWYNYNGDKYFVPASNTKLPTCYAAMKYLGDSLVGLRYGVPEEAGSARFIFAIKATGDPTFLHKDFLRQPVFDFLQQKIEINKLRCGLYIDTIENTSGWGNGWSWNDFNSDYMAERSPFPVYGNVIDIKLNKQSERTYIDTVSFPKKNQIRVGKVFSTENPYFNELINKNLQLVFPDNANNGKVMIERQYGLNEFIIKGSSLKFKDISIPFITDGYSTSTKALESIFKQELYAVYSDYSEEQKNLYSYYCNECDMNSFHIKKWNSIHSQPTDSLLKPMMHRSDNFFAEQSLLMVSNELLGVMNDAKIIDTLLKTDFKDLPQKPRWADGSGLSRYNLFTPQDFVAILNKMKNEFGMNRIKEILPTGGKGTISSYYKSDSGYIYVKTGTLSGVVALSGFLYTKKNKLLIFSTLVNNHNNSSSTGVRRAVEKFIQEIRNRY